MLRECEKDMAFEALRARLQEWRRRKPKSRRIPQCLWKMAADIARHRGIGRTAKELRLGYTELKKHVSGAECNQCETQKSSNQSGTEPLGGGFVELPGMAWGGRICLEVKRNDGSLIKMEWQESSPAGVASLLRAFLKKD